MPTGPIISIMFNDFYENLPAIVQKFIRYFFGSLNGFGPLKGVFFSGLLGATIFAGGYELPTGDRESFFITFNAVPGPEVGAGLSFVVAALMIWTGHALYHRRTFTD